MKKVFGFVLCLFVFSSQSFAVNKIVALGDSLSDTGNLYIYMNKQLPLSPPYYKGRFSSGPVWIEHLAEHFYPGNADKHLLVYAFGGSGIDLDEDEEDDVDDGAMLTLKSQVDSYLLAHHDKADSDSLFTVWMGSNNYLGVPEDEEEVTRLVVAGIEKELVRLADHGAKHIMVVNLPDLGRIPMARELESEKEMSSLTNKHNQKLFDRVQALKAQYPDVQWFHYNMNATFNEALTNSVEYGFEDVTNTCYESLEYLPTAQPVLSMASRIKPTMRIEGDLCEKYLFFDPVHPTGKAHEYLAQEAALILEGSNVSFKES